MARAVIGLPPSTGMMAHRLQRPGLQCREPYAVSLFGEPSPRPRPSRPRLFLIPQPRIYFSSQLNLAPKQPDQIRESIDVRQGMLVNFRSTFSQAYDAALCAPTDSTSNLKCSRLGERARQRPIGKNSIHRFNGMNHVRELVHVCCRKWRRPFLAFRRSRKRRPDTEQRVLDLMHSGTDLWISADTSGESQGGVQFVHRSISLNTQIGLRDAHSSGQTCLAAIASFSRNAHKLISFPATGSHRFPHLVEPGNRTRGQVAITTDP